MIGKDKDYWVELREIWKMVEWIEKIEWWAEIVKIGQNSLGRGKRKS